MLVTIASRGYAEGGAGAGKRSPLLVLGGDADGHVALAVEGLVVVGGGTDPGLGRFAEEHLVEELQGRRRVHSLNVPGSSR